MKGNKKILVIAVLLLLIAATYSTYAIYRASTNINGTIKAANWSVKVKKTGATGEGTPISSATLTFTAADIDWTSGTHTGKNNTIAPGDVGQIKFDVDALGSEVDVIVEASLGTITGLPNGFNVALASGSGSQEIAYSTTNMTRTVAIDVTWSGNLSDDSAKDGTDIAAAGSNLSIPVTLTARQKLASD